MLQQVADSKRQTPHLQQKPVSAIYTQPEPQLHRNPKAKSYICQTQIALTLLLWLP